MLIKSRKIFSKFIISVYFLLSIYILSLLFFFNHEEYNGKNYISNYNFYLFIFGFILFLILYFIIYTIKDILNYKLINIYTISFLLLILQITIIYSYYFSTGWDVKTVIENSYNLFKYNEISDIYYFSVYPNNIFIVKLYSNIINIIDFIGLYKYSYFIILIILIFLSDITGIILFKVLEKLFISRVIHYFGFIYYMFLVFFSPWISIPYSDTLTLLVPILCLYIYLYVENYYIRWAFLSLLFIISINIKPQSAIIFIALIMYDIIFSHKKISEFFRQLLLVVFMLVLSTFLIKIYEKNITDNLNKEYETSYIHFLKMGLNSEYTGSWNYDDVVFSQSIENRKERDEANLEIVKQRLLSHNLKTFINHVSRKILFIYNDGTFAWGKEGSFYYAIPDERTVLSKITREFYYENGKYYNYFNIFSQANWIFLLFLSCVGNFYNKVINNNNYKLILYMTLIGLFLFELLFEARARYIFTNVPVLIVCSMYGVQGLIEIKNKIIRSINKN